MLCSRKRNAPRVPSVIRRVEADRGRHVAYDGHAVVRRPRHLSARPRKQRRGAAPVAETPTAPHKVTAAELAVDVTTHDSDDASCPIEETIPDHASSPAELRALRQELRKLDPDYKMSGKILAPERRPQTPTEKARIAAEKAEQEAAWEASAARRKKQLEGELRAEAQAAAEAAAREADATALADGIRQAREAREAQATAAEARAAEAAAEARAQTAEAEMERMRRLLAEKESMLVKVREENCSLSELQLRHTCTCI